MTRLVFRDVGKADEPYPAWVVALDGKRGVYAIRDRSTKKVLYVGESGAQGRPGALKKTLTRHLVGWKRKKTWFRGHFVRMQHDPGTIYDRGDVEVAAFTVRTSGAAFDGQRRLIRSLDPRDNIQEQDDPKVRGAALRAAAVVKRTRPKRVKAAAKARRRGAAVPF